MAGADQTKSAPSYFVNKGISADFAFYINDLATDYAADFGRSALKYLH